MTYSKIIGTGGYLPSRVLHNHEFESMIDTTDEWIFSRTGIRQRHIADVNELTSDMAVIAARQAIANAHIKANMIDLIVLATSTPDKVFPSTACIVQEKLGIVGCPAFDVQAVCSGFVYALSVADNFIRTHSARCALVIGADIFSRITDWQDRSNCILWGDGAGAVVVQASDEHGILSSHLHADGRHVELLHTVPNARLNHETITMEGNTVFKLAVNALNDMVDEALHANQLQKSDVDWLVPHQANIRIIQATAKKLNMSMDKVIITLDTHGNTSAASIPLALNVGVQDGRIQRGHVILMEAFGGGFAWGSILMRL